MLLRHHSVVRMDFKDFLSDSHRRKNRCLPDRIFLGYLDISQAALFE